MHCPQGMGTYFSKLPTPRGFILLMKTGPPEAGLYPLSGALQGTLEPESGSRNRPRAVHGPGPVLRPVEAFRVLLEAHFAAH